MKNTIPSIKKNYTDDLHKIIITPLRYIFFLKCIRVKKSDYALAVFCNTNLENIKYIIINELLRNFFKYSIMIHTLNTRFKNHM